ncbi:MAG: HAD family hydrolase [Patescibacteria group bacterium]
MEHNWSCVDLHRVQVISFDVAFTLLGLNVYRISELVQKHLDIPCTPAQLMNMERAIRGEYTRNYDKSHAVQGKCITEIMTEMISRQPHLSIDVKTIDAFHSALQKSHLQTNLFQIIYHDALAALDYIKEFTGLKLIVISNAPVTLRRDLERIGLLHYFDHVLGSAEEGVGKPDPEIFTRAADRCGVKIEDILHIDDNPHVGVLAAQRAGMQAVLYDPEFCFYPRMIPAPVIKNHLELARRLSVTQENRDDFYWL